LIKISLKGLAKFITATEQGKRKVLRDFKYPDPEGAVQAIYYREARDLIEAHHRNRYPAVWLMERAAALNALAQTMTGQSVTRLRNNARALREYSTFWGGKSFDVLDELRLDLRYGVVRVSVVPDLHIRENESERVVKFDFASKEPDDRIPGIISQAMFEAVSTSGMRIPASGVLYVDVARRRAVRGARRGSRMAGEIRAACENIEAIWDRI
jgi:hypothetical protein